MIFNPNQSYKVYSARFPQGIVVKCEKIARVRSGAVLAFCRAENGRVITFPVSKWGKYKI